MATDLLAALAQSAYSAAQNSGVRVTLETNITPPATIYDAADTRPSVLDMLGIKAYVKVATSDGRPLAEFGEPVAFNPFLAVAYATVLVLGVVAFGAVVSRVLR
jgi:hypothetical protein